MKDGRHLGRELHVANIDAPVDKVLRGARRSRSGCTSSSPDSVLKSELVSERRQREDRWTSSFTLDVLPPGFKVQNVRNDCTYYPQREAVHDRSRSTSSSPTSASEYKFDAVAGREGHASSSSRRRQQGQGADARRVAAEGRAARDRSAMQVRVVRQALGHRAATPPSRRAEPTACVVTRPASSVPRRAVRAASRRRGCPRSPIAGPLERRQVVAPERAASAGAAGAHERHAGRTRQLNFFLVNERFVRRRPARATASPWSARSAERRSWGPLVEDYLRERATLRGVVAAGRRAARSRGGGGRAARLPRGASSCRRVLVATKLDKLSRGSRRRRPSLRCAARLGAARRR